MVAWMHPRPALAVSVILLLGTHLPAALATERQDSGSSPQTGVSFNLAQIFEPPGPASPQQTTGGGRRNADSCQAPQNPTTTKLALDQVLVALIPNNNSGLTLAERPSFLFYVPKTSAKEAEFVLDNPKRVATVKLALKQTPGVYRVQLPATTPSLQVGKKYYWAFSMVCGVDGRLEDPLVKGQIQRIAPTATLTQQLSKATPLERVNLYATAGIWYEAVNGLATLRQEKPTDPKLTTAWTTLLHSVGLDAIAPAPLVK